MAILWDERHVRFWGYLDLYWNSYICQLMWSVNNKFAPNVDALWPSHLRITKKPTCFSSCSFSNFCIKSCAPSNEANQKCHKWLWWLANIAGKSSVQHSMEQTLPCYRYVLELVSSLAEIMPFDSSQSKSKNTTGKCGMSNFKPTWKIAWFSLQQVVVWCGAVSACLGCKMLPDLGFQYPYAT